MWGFMSLNCKIGGKRTWTHYLDDVDDSCWYQLLPIDGGKHNTWISAMCLCQIESFVKGVADFPFWTMQCTMWEEPQERHISTTTPKQYKKGRFRSRRPKKRWGRLPQIQIQWCSRWAHAPLQQGMATSTCTQAPLNPSRIALHTFFVSLISYPHRLSSSLMLGCISTEMAQWGTQMLRHISDLHEAKKKHNNSLWRSSTCRLDSEWAPCPLPGAIGTSVSITSLMSIT